MFKTNELSSLNKSLEYSINSLESYLDKYKEYLSNVEKMEMIKELENYKLMNIKIENIIGNQELEKALQ